MIHWPKKWIECFTCKLQDFYPEKILQNLYEVGALKDPPKPNEIMYCIEHESPRRPLGLNDKVCHLCIIYIGRNSDWSPGNPCKFVKFREVLDEE